MPCGLQVLALNPPRYLLQQESGKVSTSLVLIILRRAHHGCEDKVRKHLQSSEKTHSVMLTAPVFSLQGMLFRVVHWPLMGQLEWRHV